MTIIEKIAAFDSGVRGCQITDTITLKDCATMYLFDCVDADGYTLESSAIEYADGTIMFLDDWQNGRPEILEEIEDYDWVTADGKTAVILTGFRARFSNLIRCQSVALRGSIPRTEQIFKYFRYGKVRLQGGSL